MWPDYRLINLFDIELPIIQAPMAGSVHVQPVDGARRQQDGVQAVRHEILHRL